MGKKQPSKREAELLEKNQRDLVLEKVLRFSQKRFKKFDEVLLRLYAGENLAEAAGTDQRISKVRECFKALVGNKHVPARKTLRDAFIYLDKCSDLVHEESHIQMVYNVVQLRSFWRNDLFNWKPLSKQKSQQWHELIRYLFHQFDTPTFLYKAFLQAGDLLHMHWFIHITIGKRVKDLPMMPIPFTQKIGHYFLQAPHQFSVAEALRWAQVMGMGGDQKLAERIAASWLSVKPYQHEDFWETFIHLLIRGGMFNLSKITELIDYVRECKRENVQYHLKGRTLQSLMRQSDEWHGRFTTIKGNQFWKPSGIEGCEVKRKECLLKMEELTESKLLAEEGRAMKHCVGSYTYYCAKGKTAIFSLRKYTHGLLLEVLATIEVNVALRKVMQAKAKMNAQISADARKILDDWAEAQGLTINTYL